MIFKNLVSGFFLGLGFMMAIVLVIVGIEELDWEPGQKENPIVEEVETVTADKVSSKVESLRFFKQRVIISVSAFNGNTQPAINTTLYTTIFYENKPIDECSESYLDLDSNASKTVNVYCSWRWKELDEDKLSARSRIELSRY